MSKLQITKLEVGQMQENCYIVSCEKTNSCLIIDPGDEANYIAEKILALHITPVGIVATHGHFDHILAALELQLIFKVPFMIHEKDLFLLDHMRESAAHFLQRPIVEMKPVVNKNLHQNDVIEIGDCELFVIETSGHTPGSVSLYSKEDAIIFVGDVIFASGNIGRTDHSYCRPLELRDSIEKILLLPKVTEIYSGHGEKTTVENEIVYHRAKG